MSEPQYFIRQGEVVQGPFSGERIRGWIATGRVRPEMELSDDGTRFRRGDQFPGLFDAPVAAAESESAPRPGRRRDDDSGPRRSRSTSRPPPPASIVVIGCRVLGVIALIVALSVGQWAQITAPNRDPTSGGPESRTTFGLTETSIYVADGNALRTYGNLSYSDIAGPPNPMQEPAGTSKTLGLVIGTLILAAALLTTGAFGELFGKPGLSVLATFGLLASMGTSIVGWVFMSVGIVNASAQMISTTTGGKLTGKASGGFSFYTSILAVLFLAIAWTRSRVVAMDDRRRRSLPPPPKRRRSRQ